MKFTSQPLLWLVLPRRTHVNDRSPQSNDRLTASFPPTRIHPNAQLRQSTGAFPAPAKLRSSCLSSRSDHGKSLLYH
jgi:hypothetical protein